MREHFAALKLLGGETYVRDRNDLADNIVTQILQHILDQKRALGDRAIYRER